MQKPIIAVDIDDVLSRTAEDFIRFSNERWGHAHTIEHFDENVAELWQVSREVARERLQEYLASDVVGSHQVIDGALEVLQLLGQRYKLIAVTSRYEQTMPLTLEWLGRNYEGVIEEVIPSRIYGVGNANPHALTKGPLLRELGVNYIIDDQPKHCIGAAEHGVKAVLFGDYPWSRAAELPAGVVRCKTWKDVEEYFAHERP